MVAHGAERENFGSLFMRAHNACEQVRLDTSNNLQNISIRYENDKAQPRWDYANNNDAYAAIVDAVKSLSSADSNVRTIVIEGAASPVGSEEYNFDLALRRANVLRDIISRMEGGDKLKIRTISAGEDWRTFKSYIEQNYYEPNRDQVLAVLDTDLSNDSKERQLQNLDGGRTWQTLVRDFMATARNAAMVHIVEIDELAPSFSPLKIPSVLAPIKADMLTLVAKPSVVDKSIEVVKAVVASADSLKMMPQPQVEPQPQEQLVPQSQSQQEIEGKQQTVAPIAPRKPVVAVRSNLLVPALNFGVEVPIGTNWSVGADYYFPWVWPKRDNKNCFEFLGWGIEGRYWFGRNRTVFDRLQGHSLGLYGYMGYYDFERNFHGHQGEFINIGLDYTYAMAVGKKKSVHFEFSLGVGYIYSQARKYTVIESGAPLISDKITKKIGFFGPTKANISLVVPIFQKVKPNDKQRGNE